MQTLYERNDVDNPEEEFELYEKAAAEYWNR